MANSSGDFSRDAHILYLLRMLHELPSPYETQETSRLSLAYFIVSGLDILDALNKVPTLEVIEWVYALQVLPVNEDGQSASVSDFGFRGSPCIGIPFSPPGALPRIHDGAHLAMTYSALALLRILGDDCSRVCQDAILASMRLLQQPDGSFSPVQTGGESDMRFIFCAAAICALLDNWSGMNVCNALKYISRCQSYDDGFGLSPGLEAHGGATYCAVATLMLARKSHYSDQSGRLLSDVGVKRLIDWCFKRQSDAGGFQGRTNKDPDTCYAFWVGGTLRMLGVDGLLDRNALRGFLLSCQSKIGGFSKWPDEWPDLLHAYYGICGFSLLGEPGLNPLCYELGISQRASSGLFT